MTLPSRRSRILRIDPDGLGPPAATTADSIVDWLDSVTTPGRCAGPTTNTRRPRSWPSETERLKLVNSRADLRAQVLLEVGGLDAGDVEAAHLGQVEHAVAVDRAAVVDVDRAPGAGHDLVARADRVVGRDRHVVERLEGVGGVGEERRAEDRQQPPGRAFDEALELVRLRRRRRLGAAREGVARDRGRCARRCRSAVRRAARRSWRAARRCCAPRRRCHARYRVAAPALRGG